MKVRSLRSGRVWTAIVLAGSLVACGFHLQGNLQLPAAMRQTYVETSDNDSPLARKLRRALADTGVVVAAQPADATAVLKVLKDDAGQRVLSVSPTGVPEEYELYHTVRFSLESGGRTLLEPYETTVTRDYNFDPTDVLGKRHEAEYLEDAMVDDIVQLILRHVALVKE
jgi:LPS-assembly lipoprotein